MGIVSGKSKRASGGLEDPIFLSNLNDLGSRIEILGSEGVYLDEKCRTNLSRHLPGPKTPHKK